MKVTSYIFTACVLALIVGCSPNEYDQLKRTQAQELLLQVQAKDKKEREKIMKGKDDPFYSKPEISEVFQNTLGSICMRTIGWFAVRDHQGEVIITKEMSPAWVGNCTGQRFLLK